MSSIFIRRGVLEVATILLSAQNALAQAPPAAVAHKIDPTLTYEDGPADVYVEVCDPTGRRPTDCRFLEQIVELIGPENIVDWDCPDAFMMRLGREEVELLAADPRIRAIERDYIYSPALFDVVEIVDAVDTWAMTLYGTPLTGAGGTVAVIDTGVDWSHPDLAHKNIAGGTRDCTQGIECPLDLTAQDVINHGTHVAGIVGAEGAVLGVGKGVDLISIKVFEDGNPYASTMDIKRAIRWATDHRDEYDIKVITLSIASNTLHLDHCDQYSTSITSAVDDAVAAGIVVTAATGNNHETERIASPACKSNVIPVSATSKDGDWATYANYNGLVKLFAPGSSVYSTCAGGGHCYKSGTSMSTPATAGAVAVIRQALDALGVAMHPLDIEQLFFDTGDPVLDLPFEEWRRINLAAAMTELIARHTSPADITLDGVVDEADLDAVLNAWGPCPDPPAWCRPDLDGDDMVGFEDLLVVLSAWG